MPNRMIKESIRTSRSVNALNDFQFRLWLYLITYVDDYGRGSADPELIKGMVFPRRKGVTENQIRDALAVLASAGMVILYEVGGEPYLYFPKWGDHQRIQTKTSKFPDPTDGNEIPPESTVSHGESPLEARIEARSEKREAEGRSAPARHKHGQYDNVLLSDEDLSRLQEEFPADWQQRIERLSAYIAQTGKSYKNHLATIRNWARRDKEQAQAGRKFAGQDLDDPLPY